MAIALTDISKCGYCLPLMSDGGPWTLRWRQTSHWYCCTGMDSCHSNGCLLVAVDNVH